MKASALTLSKKAKTNIALEPTIQDEIKNLEKIIEDFLNPNTQISNIEEKEIYRDINAIIQAYFVSNNLEAFIQQLKELYRSLCELMEKYNFSTSIVYTLNLIFLFDEINISKPSGFTLFRIGNIYRSGEGTKVDLEKAKYFYQKAHAICLQLILKKSENTLIDVGIAYRILGELNEQGLIVKQDIDSAIYNYTSCVACSKDIPTNQTNKSDLFLSARQHYEKAFSYSASRLFTLYKAKFLANKTTDNLDRAINAAIVAADGGDYEACYFLGTSYHEGLDNLIKKDLKLAAQYIDLASEIVFPYEPLELLHRKAIIAEEMNNYKYAIYAYKILYDASYKKLLRAYFNLPHESEEKKYTAIASIKLGQAYFEGKYGVEINIKEALEYYDTAALAGSEEAMLFLVEHYKKNSNTEQELKYLLKLEQNHPDAAFRMGNIYEKNAKLDLAVVYYYKATQKNYPRAFLRMAELYEEDKVTPGKPEENKKDAKRHFTLAFAAFQKEAETYKTPAVSSKDMEERQYTYYTLATLCHQGKGTDCNLLSAYKYFELAEQAGHPSAEEKKTLILIEMEKENIHLPTKIIYTEEEEKESYSNKLKRLYRLLDGSDFLNGLNLIERETYYQANLEKNGNDIKDDPISKASVHELTVSWAQAEYLYCKEPMTDASKDAYFNAYKKSINSLIIKLMTLENYTETHPAKKTQTLRVYLQLITLKNAIYDRYMQKNLLALGKPPLLDQDLYEVILQLNDHLAAYFKPTIQQPDLDLLDLQHFIYCRVLHDINTTPIIIFSYFQSIQKKLQEKIKNGNYISDSIIENLKLIDLLDASNDYNPINKANRLYDLAKKYAEGVGVKIDPEKSRSYYKLAYEEFLNLSKNNTDYKIWYSIAYLTENGLGCEKDVDKAIEYYKKVLAYKLSYKRIENILDGELDHFQVHINAKNKLAHIYFQRGDDALALKELELSLRAKNYKGLCLAGTIYKKQKEFMQAAEVYQAAIKLPIPDSERVSALFERAKLHEMNEEYEKAGDLYQRVIAFKNDFYGNANFRLGKLYYNNHYNKSILHRNDKNTSVIENSLRCLNCAMREKNVDAMGILAEFYLTNRGPEFNEKHKNLENLYQDLLKYLEEAAENGNKKAQFAYAQTCEFLSYPPQWQKAQIYYKKSSNQGYYLATYALGKMYKYENFPSELLPKKLNFNTLSQTTFDQCRDFIKNHVDFDKTALGHAYFLMGELLEDDSCIDKDKENPTYYYQLAANYDYEEAKIKLKTSPINNYSDTKPEVDDIFKKPKKKKKKNKPDKKTSTNAKSIPMPTLPPEEAASKIFREDTTKAFDECSRQIANRNFEAALKTIAKIKTLNADRRDIYTEAKCLWVNANCIYHKNVASKIKNDESKIKYEEVLSFIQTKILSLRENKEKSDLITLKKAIEDEFNQFFPPEPKVLPEIKPVQEEPKKPKTHQPVPVKTVALQRGIATIKETPKILLTSATATMRTAPVTEIIRSETIKTPPKNNRENYKDNKNGSRFFNSSSVSFPPLVKREAITISLSKNAKDIIRTLREKGDEIYVHGGAVRDGYLNAKKNKKKKARDEDLISNLTLDKIIDHLRKSNKFKSVEKIGTRFPIVQVTCHDNTIIEISSLQKPDSGSGYVKTTLESDYRSRDFPINAFYFLPDTMLSDDEKQSGILIDFGDGMVDIAFEIIRFIGDPTLRITEDPVRILRAIRLAAELDFQIEQKAKLAIQSLIYKLNDINLDRFDSEIKKLIDSPAAENIFNMMQELKLIDTLQPLLAQFYERNPLPRQYQEFLVKHEYLYKPTPSPLAQQPKQNSSSLFTQAPISKAMEELNSCSIIFPYK